MTKTEKAILQHFTALKDITSEMYATKGIDKESSYFLTMTVLCSLIEAGIDLNIIIVYMESDKRITLQACIDKLKF